VKVAKIRPICARLFLIDLSLLYGCIENSSLLQKAKLDVIGYSLERSLLISSFHRGVSYTHRYKS